MALCLKEWEKNTDFSKGWKKTGLTYVHECMYKAPLNMRSEKWPEELKKKRMPLARVF